MTATAVDKLTPHLPRARSRFVVRMVAWLLVIAFAVQLLGVPQHRHAHQHKHHSTHCASCVFAAHAQTPPADPMVALITDKPSTLRYVLASTAMADAGRDADPVRPCGHGPPPRPSA